MKQQRGIEGQWQSNVILFTRTCKLLKPGNVWEQIFMFHKVISPLDEKSKR